MKLKTILTLLAALGILTACNDDFFDQVPDDRITIEQVFQRTSYSEKYLATVYSYIRDESHRTNGVPWDPCSDDLDVTYDREDYNSFKMNLGNWSASSNYYEYWSHYYRGIRSAILRAARSSSNNTRTKPASCAPGSITACCASTVRAYCWATKSFRATSTATM